MIYVSDVNAQHRIYSSVTMRARYTNNILTDGGIRIINYVEKSYATH